MIEIAAKKNEAFSVEFVTKDDPHIRTWRLDIEKVFHGEYLKSFYIPMQGQAVLLVGCGEFSHPDLLEIRELAAFAARELKHYGILQCSLDISPLVERMGEKAVTQVVLGLELGLYEYKAKHLKYGESVKDTEEHLLKLKKDKSLKPPKEQVWYGLYGIQASREMEELIGEAVELSRDIRFVRDMVNTPGNMLRPMDFNRAIEEYLKDVEVETETIVYGQLKLLGLQGLYGIGGSSEFPPCLMVLRYRGNPTSSGNYGLIGKGVTCDTGGYCLKGAKSMEGIKGDMAGAAAVVGALHAAASRRLKVNITAVLPLCENRISPSSHLPGDVITSYSGKTVEILNTDAEGRLILADTMSYAIRQEKVTKVLDIATLTRAVWRALGYTIAGSMSDDDEFYSLFQRALANSGEQYLRFPFGKEHEKMLMSAVADLKNIGGDCCGTITAGLFIRHFAENLPWIHLDIAGTAWIDTPLYAYESKGATGAGVTSLYYMLKEAEE